MKPKRTPEQEQMLEKIQKACKETNKRISAYPEEKRKELRDNLKNRSLGEKWVEENREICNKMTPKQRKKYFEIGMKIINGEK